MNSKDETYSHGRRIFEKLAKAYFKNNGT